MHSYDQGDFYGYVQTIAKSSIAYLSYTNTY